MDTRDILVNSSVCRMSLPDKVVCPVFFCGSLDILRSFNCISEPLQGFDKFLVLFLTKLLSSSVVQEAQ